MAVRTVWKKPFQIFSVFALLFLVAISTSGCGELIGNIIKNAIENELDDGGSDNGSTRNDQNDQNDLNNQNDQNDINGGLTSKDEQISSLPTLQNISFTNINWINGPPSLQEKSGIYYYTKDRHPAEVENSFRYDTHNGWLIQLDPIRHAQYNGYKMKVTSVAKTTQPSLYKITVHLEPGGDSPSKPAYCFFEVGIFDMPTTSRFVVVTDTGKALIY
jgi:hypothetical protein